MECFRAPVKLGYCRAYNLLMARRTGRYVLLLDDDTVLLPDTIAGMVHFMDAHPEVGNRGLPNGVPGRLLSEEHCGDVQHGDRTRERAAPGRFLA